MSAIEGKLFVKTILSSYNVLVHILMGMIVGVALLFAVKKRYNEPSVPEDIILLHILLCVPGYILIMSQSILSMTSYNTWSSSLSEVNKRRAHWILQILGAGMAATGSIMIMIYKDVNFDTLHGKVGLVALVFTTVSVVVGIAALFSNNLRKFIPPIVSKITHIVLGIVTYASASTALCYAFDKTMFKLWTSDNVALGVISFTGIFTLIILINPLVTLSKKIITLIRTKL